MPTLKAIIGDLRAWIVGLILTSAGAYVWTFFPSELFSQTYSISTTLEGRDIVAGLSGALVILFLVALIAAAKSRKSRIYRRRERIMMENTRLLSNALRSPDLLVRSTRVTYWDLSENSVARSSFRARLTELIAGKNTVRRLWQIRSRDDMNRMQLYIDQYAGSDNYNVRAILLHDLVIPEILVIGNDICSISFPSVASPRQIEVAMHFKGKFYVSAIQEYFDVLWEAATPVKTGKEVFDESIKEIRSQVRYRSG